MTVDADTLLAAIDRHLREIPSDRSTVTAETMRDALLDLRLLVAHGETSISLDAPTTDADGPPTGGQARPAAVDDPVEGFASDFPDEDVVVDVELDPPLTGLDLAREVEVPAEARTEDFPDDLDDSFDGDNDDSLVMTGEAPFGAQPEDQLDDRGAAEQDDEGLGDEPQPEPEPAIHLRLATSAHGVIARCGQLIEASGNDSTTPWTEDVTCGGCLDAVTVPADPAMPAPVEASQGAEPTPKADGAAAEAAADAAASDPVEPSGEASWIDEDDGAVIHQLVEVKASGSTKDGVAKCGHVETVTKTDRFTETVSWPDAVTCAACSTAAAA